MTTHLPGVDLGAVDLTRHRRRRPGDLRRRLVYLAGQEAIAVAQRRVHDGWRCQIAAHRAVGRPAATIDFTDHERGPTPTVFPAQPQWLAGWQARMLWLAWIHQRF